MFFQLCVRPDACSSLQFVSHTVVWWFHVILVEQVLGVTSKELIPKGTRFGPLVGESYTNETLLKDADRKYFWRVSELHVNLKCAVVCVHILYLHLESLLWGCGMAWVSSCGQRLTSCESLTRPANVWAPLNADVSDGFKSACAVNVCWPVPCMAAWGYTHTYSCLVSVTQRFSSLSASLPVNTPSIWPHFFRLINSHTD